MKNTVLLLLALICIVGCREEENPPTVSVKYEVITTSGPWFGEYIDGTGTKICTCNSQLLLPNGWTLEFNVAMRPFVLHIDATAGTNVGQNNMPDVTTNIYVDNKLVATNTSNWAQGVASADWVIE